MYAVSYATLTDVTAYIKFLFCAFTEPEVQICRADCVD